MVILLLGVGINLSFLFFLFNNIIFCFSLLMDRAFSSYASKLDTSVAPPIYFAAVPAACAALVASAAFISSYT